MTLAEILEEIPRLTEAEKRQLVAKLGEREVTPSGDSPETRVAETSTPAGQDEKKPWQDVFIEIAGTVHDLPPDFADQHDHYLYGTPKR